MGVTLIVVTWIYLLSTSVANLFTELISVDGLLYASFYILTALAAMVYYRRRVFSNAWDALLVGLLPLGAIAFLVWIVVKTLQSGTPQERWSLIGIVAAGVLVMVAIRVIVRPGFFQIPRESASKASR
jgi:amino acid transporter